MYSMKEERYRDFNLVDFILESNRIEGILHHVTTTGYANDESAHEKFLSLKKITVEDLEEFVSLITTTQVHQATLRRKKGMNVYVGDHHPPPGGHQIEIDLTILLNKVNNFHISSYEAHLEYEKLHPFSDGNGRSGRALWLWMHNGEAPLGFLHTFYYQTLKDSQ